MTRGVSISKPSSAALRIRVLPWRVRLRKLDASKIREYAFDMVQFDDSFLVGLLVGVAVVLVAPLIAFLLVLLLVPVEAGLAALIAVAVLLVRAVGIVPWTVAVDYGDGESVESYRSVVSAVRRVRSINSDHRLVIRVAMR